MWERYPNCHQAITSRDSDDLAWIALVWDRGDVSIRNRDGGNYIINLHAIDQDFATRIAMTAMDALLAGQSAIAVQDLIDNTFVAHGYAINRRSF